MLCTCISEGLGCGSWAAYGPSGSTMLPILKETKGRPRTFAGAGTALDDILAKHIRLHPGTRGRVFVYKMDKFLPPDPSSLMVWRNLIRESAPQ